MWVVLRKVRTLLRFISFHSFNQFYRSLVFRFDVLTNYRFRPFIVLGSFYGGLGDNLQLSTLPEEFFRQYKKKTYLSTRSNSRNIEIQELVWSCNPFVIGFQDSFPTAGDFPQMRSKKFSKGMNLISHWEKVHGLEVSNRLPKVYFRPTRIDSLKESILVDLSAVTLIPDPNLDTVNSYDPNVLSAELQKYCSVLNPEQILRVSFKNNLAKGSRYLNHESNTTSLNNASDYPIESIYDYVDAIYSCKAIITIYSGAAVLASAIRQNSHAPIITTFITTRNLNHEKENVNFIFENVNYIEF